MRTMEVDLGDRSYPIHIGPNLLDQTDLLTPHIRGRQVMVVSNETVAPIYLSRLLSSLADYQVSTVILPDGEQYKTLETLNLIYDALLTEGHNRTTTLIALGGGVVGDMTGYAAASYQRGVDFIQIPTTLLSQVDSSVGGKTGVNHRLGKNMIGAFHQPKCVLADTSVLETLPPRELAAGIAEVVKYGLICDRPFYDWLEVNMTRLVKKEQDSLVEAVYQSCLDKAKVVAEDELESGIRAILNLGHTFGHAIETAQGYGNWLHGEAVAAGMVMAMELSCQKGWVSRTECDQLLVLLQKADLPVSPPPNMTIDQFKQLMARDKKVIDGLLRLVLLSSVGEAVVTSEVTESELEQLLAVFGLS